MPRLTTTPKADGFRMPGEFEKQEKIWMIWPERPDNWREKAIPAQKDFVTVATAISEFAKMIVIASKSQFATARKQMPDNIEVIEMESDDSWVRDCGPTFLVNDKGTLRGVDWKFNAWGGSVDGLYETWDNDDKIASQICDHESVDSYRTEDFVLEGGSIHTDGQGTIFTTEACLLSKGRNPNKSKEEIEATLKEYLGAEKVIWLKNGIYLDETNEHVDNIMHVVAPGKIVLAWTDDETDPQYALSKAAYETLSNETDAKGRKFEIFKLFTPKPLIEVTEEEANGVLAVDGTLPREAGDRQAASYANFLIVNNGVILPIFDREQDNEAIKTLQEALPNHKIVTVPGREIVLGGGNVHCITQQQPSVEVK